MRPFIELQNQNMMNMQYMMMMAQQSRGNEGHCCNHHNQNNSEPKVIYMPFPQYNQMPPIQQQYAYPQQQPFVNNQYQQQPQQLQTHQFGSVKSIKRSQTQKKLYNFQKIKKFRVAVIAIYFYLLFPKFANLFTKRRFKLHSEKYYGTTEPHHSNIIAKAFDTLSDINYF